ncbi:MAG TPA: cytochrome b/b6 domain-containing protein [Burkholderiales bacterium]|nr:cytochrome b/b6 domain-containing protein [Burkholderiales bacterium]
MADRYHPLQVLLHWLSAALTIGAWGIGAIAFERIPSGESAQRILVLGIHMAAGLSVAFIVALRLALRLSLAQPARATSGSVWLDRLARVVHAALYAAALAMAASGLALAVQAGLPQVVFGGLEAALPEDLRAYGARGVHALIGTILISLVALHALAAFYHHFVRRDGLLARMWFGARGAPE